jgi:flagellar biosynthesis protein FlhB
VRITTAELEELAALYAPTKRDDYLPPPVQHRVAQMRAVIDEVKMWRETAGSETE